MTNILNDLKVNLLKIVVNNSNVELETPELFRTFAFSKEFRNEAQIKYLNFYSIVGPKNFVSVQSYPAY